MKGRIFEASPGIWCVGIDDVWAYVVRLFPGGVLIDTGPDSTGGVVMNALQQARIGLASLRAIVLTHSDFEASAGAARLQSRSGAPVLVSDEQKGILQKQRRASYWRRLIRQDTARGRAEGVAPSAIRVIRDSERIHDVMEAVSLEDPSSCERDGRFAFYFRPTRALFSGDVLDTSSVPWRLARGRSAAALRERYPDVTAVFPNHGKPQTDPESVRAHWATME